MKSYLKTTYGVEYKSGIYDLLERLNLSHQKAHFDYSNADPEKQKAFVAQLKDDILATGQKTTGQKTTGQKTTGQKTTGQKTSIVFFDEFSVSEKPTSFYGWAQKNTRPKVVTNEKNESGSMDC